jgi:hypothetical protein
MKRIFHIFTGKASERPCNPWAEQAARGHTREDLEARLRDPRTTLDRRAQLREALRVKDA